MRSPNRSQSLLVICLALALPVPTVLAADAEGPRPEALENAPPNQWVNVLAAKTGKRDQPIFVYASKIDRFVAAAGMQHYGGVRPRHYDTEEFDLATCTWINAYPPGMEKGRPKSGPVGETYARERAKHGHHGRKLFYKDGDYLRLGAGGQWHNGKTYGEYCYVPDVGEAGTVYAYMHRTHTVAYDVAKRTWTDPKPKPRTKARIWGSMAYDPVNKEILHTGGGSGSAEVSTWAYDINENEWRELDVGSDALKKLHKQGKKLCWKAKTLVGRCASRHQVAETEAEAKVDLAAEAKKLATTAEELAGEVMAAELAEHEKTAGDVAVHRLGLAADAVRELGPKLGGAIPPALIAEARAAREVFEQVVDALSPQPGGRARSQIAYDAASKTVVLFGGDRLDRVLSDTWIYDCKTRTWEQRFPNPSPAPRAGHILDYLPKAKKVVLAGGYSRVPLAQDIWAYDVAANHWALLMHAPLKRGRRGSYSPGCPNVAARTFQVGAVNDDDVLVCFNGNNVWACKIEPGKADAALTAEKGVKPGIYTWNTMSPADWETVAKPDPERMKTFREELPANQWTTIPFPKYAPGARNRWGTTAYDTDRHQFLFWGGGHATSHENDVAHFSLLGGFWTIGYHPDDPIERVYASQPTFLSFNDRVHVPVHAYRAYCYDPVAKKMFYDGRAYDPLVREWVPKGYPGLSWRGPMHSHMESTPGGAIAISSKGLFRFDAKAETWQKLQWKGARMPKVWCDGTAVCYDSKRDCLWIADARQVLRYDFATGSAKKLDVKKPKAVGRWMLWAEQVYLPDADLILLMRAFKKPDGTRANIAWSPADKKYYWVELPYVSGGKPAKIGRGFSWHSALRYDPELELVLLNHSSARRVWALKFDRTTAKMEAIKAE
ncbi:MAG: kelch repeat-containing protein [Planctomycetota bacterium]